VDIGAVEVKIANLVVDTTDDGNDGDYSPGHLSLREAIAEIERTDSVRTITFDPAVFATHQTITLTGGVLELSGSLNQTTITPPAAGLTVNGNNQSRVFQIDSGVTAILSGLTITGGNAGSGDGGGLLAYGPLTLTDCTFSGNTGRFGGGIAIENTATLSNSTFTQNTASFLGGGVFSSSPLAQFLDLTVSGNFAFYGGGIAIDGGAVTLTNSTISQNNAYSGGGAFVQGGMTVTNCSLSENVASYGGGVYIIGGGTFIDSTVSGNSAYQGGGVYFGAGFLTTVRSTISGNSATQGGGIFNISESRSMTLSDSTFANTRRPTAPLSTIIFSAARY